MAERKPAKCWVVGKAIEADGIKGIVGPFTVFDEEGVANQACDMVERTSGVRPMKADGSLWRERQPRERRAKAPT